jgi:hypothetical protein
MVRRARVLDPVVTAAIDGLLEKPPADHADLARRLSTVGASHARRVLVERLRSGAIRDRASAVLVSAFARLGLGREGPALVEIAADRSVSLAIRAQAVAVLLAAGPAAREALMTQLSPEEGLALAERSIDDLLAAIGSDPARSSLISAALEGVSSETRHALLDRIESRRRSSGTRAAFTYQHPLTRDRLRPLWPTILKHLVNDGGVEAIEFLEGLRDAAQDAHAHRVFQGAVLRLRTRAIEARA